MTSKNIFSPNKELETELSSAITLEITQFVLAQLEEEETEEELQKRLDEINRLQELEKLEEEEDDE